jgi:hypothetical protein
MIVEQLTDLLDDILQGKNEMKLRSDTRRKRLRCASDTVIRSAGGRQVLGRLWRIRSWTFDVGRSSLKPTP